MKITHEQIDTHRKFPLTKSFLSAITATLAVTAAWAFFYYDNILLGMVTAIIAIILIEPTYRAIGIRRYIESGKLLPGYTIEE